MTSYTVVLDNNDITADVLSVAIHIGGKLTPFRRVANVGTCTLLLNNDARTYSPANSASPIAGSLLPYKHVTVTVTDGSAYTVFDGVVETITPDAGQGMNQGRCLIQCMDWLGVLQGYLISLPLQTAKTPGYLLKLITSAAMRGARATGTISFAATPSVNDTITIDGVTYTFVDTPANPYDVARGSSAEDAANNLAAAIHTAGVEFGAGLYGDNTQRHPTVTAEVSVSAAGGGGTVTTPAPIDFGGYVYFGKSGTIDLRKAQMFVPVTGQLDEFSVPIGIGDSDTIDVTWEVTTSVGGVPSETVLATGTFAAIDGTVTVSGIAGPILSDTQEYALVLRKVGVTAWEDTSRVYSGADWDGTDQPYAYYSTGNGWTRGVYGYIAEASITTIAYSGAIVTLTAVARGAWGNSITLAKSGADITVSGSTLGGGTDAPAGKLSISDGIVTINTAGDQWSDARTNALSAIQDVVESECGFFWAARDGTLTFKDQQFTFLLGNATPDLTVNNTHTQHDSGISVRDIINRVSVSYIPRGTTATGVVARSQAILSVPGRGDIDKNSSNYARWNPSDAITQEAGSRTFTIPFVDVDTGRVVGAESLVLPLEAGTDYAISDGMENTGNYTTRGYLKISVSVTGNGIEVHFTNTALGTLYVHNFQVRGVALIAYDPLNVVIDDETSQQDYGRRGYDVTLPLPLSNGDTFAETLGRYILNEYAQPIVRVMAVGCQGITSIGGTSLFSLDIGDMLDITEAQTGDSGILGWITGIGYTLSRSASPGIMFEVMRVGGQNYWVLGEAGFSELGETTWLGM